tara:strand:- start:225 stop:470 length:246 start_codon:yes stop_codon:yes gene_type:complete
MTRLFKSITSLVVMLAMVAVLPAETSTKTNQVEFAVEQDSDVILVASADVKKKKKQGTKTKGDKKTEKKKTGFFSKVFGDK